MKIINIPYETTVKCDRCGCTFEFDKDDICISEVRATTLDKANQHTVQTLYVVCPFCRKHYRLKKKEDRDD